MPITFDAFMKRVDAAIINKTGLGVYDFADATWRDLFEDTGGECSDQDIFDLLADYDDTFAAMMEALSDAP